MESTELNPLQKDTAAVAGQLSAIRITVAAMLMAWPEETRQQVVDTLKLLHRQEYDQLISQGQVQHQEAIAQVLDQAVTMFLHFLDVPRA